MLAAEGLLGHQHANSGWGTFDDDNMVGATAFMETLELALELRRANYGANGERLGFDLYPYTEDAVAAVKRSVLQWNFIDSVAAKIDDAALREAQSTKDAVRAYEIVYAALGAYATSGPALRIAGREHGSGSQHASAVGQFDDCAAFAGSTRFAPCETSTRVTGRSSSDFRSARSCSCPMPVGSQDSGQRRRPPSSVPRRTSPGTTAPCSGIQYTTSVERPRRQCLDRRRAAGRPVGTRL